VFCIRHGDNWLARTLARLVGLPAAADAADVQLLVIPCRDGEQWQRTFAGESLASMQSRRSNAVLVERIGLIELRFQLQVVDGTLAYTSLNGAMCLGSWRVPLPSWISPRVTALERPVGQGDQIYVSVDVHVPMVGTLIAYDGTLAVIETKE
jgi:hypothetical protein